jgi:hypothetical protein
MKAKKIATVIQRLRDEVFMGRSFALWDLAGQPGFVL